RVITCKNVRVLTHSKRDCKNNQNNVTCQFVIFNPVIYDLFTDKKQATDSHRPLVDISNQWLSLFSDGMSLF
ncbi:MAG: hypothetical protein K2J78_00515, partial [Muribaculaceae bacterium]|nr:hypothetical protein [Muribaculaceae bacterium]MDE6768187.1 hypothetical protein [Muribaculaceae bacterium]